MNLEKKKKFLINCGYFTVWTILLYLLFKVAAVHLFPFLIGVLIAYLVQKPAAFFSSKTKIKTQWCAAILSVVFYILVIVILALLCWIIYTQIDKLMLFLSNRGGLSYYIKTLSDLINQFFENFDGDINTAFNKMTNETINNFITKISTFLSSSVTTFVKKLPTILISSVVTVVATCYISKDFDRLKKFVSGFVNDNLYKKAIEIKNVFTSCFLKIAVGYFWLFLIAFAELFVGLFILNVNNFIIIALITAFVDILPVFGAGAVLLPWAIIGFLQNNYKLGIGLTILYIAIVVAKNFAEPKIIGNQIGINPLFTLLFIFLGLRLGGIIGMITVPIILTVAFTYYRKQILTDNKIG